MTTTMEPSLFAGTPECLPELSMAEAAQHYVCHVEFFVPGKPASAGSKKAFYNKELGRSILVPDDAKARPWTADVKAYAQIAMQGRAAILAGPVFLRTEFLFARPKGHFGSGGNAGVLKASAPKWSSSRPDVTKILRCLEDALTGIVWHDDAQVAVHVSSKRYANPEETPGAQVSVFYLSD